MPLIFAGGLLIGVRDEQTARGECHGALVHAAPAPKVFWIADALLAGEGGVEQAVAGHPGGAVGRKIRQGVGSLSAAAAARALGALNGLAGLEGALVLERAARGTPSLARATLGHDGRSAIAGGVTATGGAATSTAARAAVVIALVFLI